MTGSREGLAEASPTEDGLPMLIRHLALLALTVALSADTLPAIPPRPEALKFPALNYEPPDPRQYRVALKAGPVAYVVPDRELPHRWV